MIITVNKCITFDIKRSSTKSVQYHSRLLINNNLVPRVKVDDSCRCLGRYFDFRMSNKVHKKELIAIDTEKAANRPPIIHLKNKSELYNR